MDIYLFKKDLETSFSSDDILTLAKFYDKDTQNQNDLLWVLAINISGGKRAEMPPGKLYNENFLQDLPIDVLIEMVYFLDWGDINHLCRTSKYFQDKLCANEDFWKELLSRRYPGFEKSKFITWVGLAKQLRDIKNLKPLDQIKNALDLGQSDLLIILLKYEEMPMTSDIFKYLSAKVINDNKIRTSIYKNSNSFVNTLLSGAIIKDNVEYFDKLLKYARNVNIPNSAGSTPLLMAISENKPDYVIKLIKYGADIEKSIGLSPLQFAVRRKSAEIVKILIDAGVDVNKKSSIGSTAYEIAMSNGLFDIAEMLKNAGADTSVDIGFRWPKP